MTFRGFNLKYPEYEVITPQTKLSFTVRSLNVQEEENLKGSFITTAKMAEHLNKGIYDAIVKKPENIKDYDTFLRSITIKDREALLYGLYHITYEDVRNYEVICSSCEKEYAISVKMSDAFNVNIYPGPDILRDRKVIELPKSKGVFATIKQPTLFEEVVSIKQLSVRPNSSLEAITETLVIDKFEQQTETDNLEWTDREDIIDAYLLLPAKDKRAIFNTYMEEFGKYGIDLKIKSNCMSCGGETIHSIDLAASFFRALHSIR